VPPSACSKRPRRVACAPVKAPRSWPQEFALQQVLGDGRGVDRDERPACTQAVLVQRPRHQFLARAGFARDQHRDVALAEPTDRPEDVLHRWRLTEHLGHVGGGLVDAFLAQAFIHRAADQRHRLGQVEGLGQVLEGAALEGRDGTVQVGIGRHDDDRQPRVLGLDLGEQVDAGPAGHADVAHQHLRSIVFQCRQHVARVGEAAHGQFLAGQRLLQHEADGLVVVNDPDGFHAMPVSRSVRSPDPAGAGATGVRAAESVS